MSNFLEQEPLSLSKSFIVSLALLLVIAVIVGIFAWANQIRNEQVVRQYDEFTIKFVADNGGAVQDLFTLVMDACKKTFDKRPSTSVLSPQFECQEARTHLDFLNKSALPNYSSVAFIRIRNNQTEIIEASGIYHGSQPLSDNYYFNSWSRNSRQDLVRYLQEGHKIGRWQDFISQLPKKEVITPIKTGETISGYIFQSVLDR